MGGLGTCTAGTGNPALTSWLAARPADVETKHDEVPHGPSHIIPMPMQWLEAIASGAENTHTTTARTATAARQCLMARSL